MSQCCISGFTWNGTPRGREGKLGKHNAYVAGTANSGVAILFLHDINGWKFVNNRLLVDHFAKEVDATVYLPDLYVYIPTYPCVALTAGSLNGYSYDGEEVDEDLMANPRKIAEFDFMAWFGRQNKDLRGPEVFEAARILRQELGFKKVAAIGYCWGGWVAFQLGAKGINLNRMTLCRR